MLNPTTFDPTPDDHQADAVVEAHQTPAYGIRASGEAHGNVATKPHVVELILDLAGYTPDRDLVSLRLLEPACGAGAFMGPALDRLLASAKTFGRTPEDLEHCLSAYDIVPEHVDATRRLLRDQLLAHGLDDGIATRLVNRWVVEGDFLLSLAEPFDVVVGNPPYVRIEQIPTALLAEYRRRFKTLRARADLYVAFIEKGLSLLAPDGVLSFICSDRWISNQYGSRLRAFVTSKYQVEAYIDLHDASPFETNVIAYPSIFAIRNGPQAQAQDAHVRIGRLTTGSEEEVETFRRSLSTPPTPTTCSPTTWFTGDEPWVITSPEHLAALRDLESRFPLLEADGTTRVRIGVATGADEAFIVERGADIEPDRVVPLVMRDDILQGRIRDAGRCVINTFDGAGKVIDLARYPRLERHLSRFESVPERYVARKNPKAWYKTIDKVYPALVSTPKLLIPDIAGANQVTLDPGHYLPHHNLYFITSTSWDLEVLGALLSSKVALFFVWSYAVKMRGGYLRFQAQYLRRIRVPSVSGELAEKLREACRQRDFGAMDRLALLAYGLSELPEFGFVDTRK